MRTLLRDFSLSALGAGIISVLVGFTSSVAIIFQAAQSLGASEAEMGSWLWAVGIGIAVLSVILSIRYRQPIMIAWSTPGVAVIGAAGAEGHLSMPQAIGAFIISAGLIAIAGFSGGFERMMKRLPLPLASALLAGVLARFCLSAFEVIPANPALVLAMLGMYLIGRRLWPRANVPIVLLLGVAIAAGQGLLHFHGIALRITTPVWVTPEFTVGSIVGVAIPLFLVTMASQNLPGISALRVSGYEPPVSTVIGWTGVTTALLAPFGCFAVNLAAITAAFCLGPDAHPDPRRRYWATVCSGIFYAVVGFFGVTVIALLAAFPKELILAVAGLALLTTIGQSLHAAVTEEKFREASVLTFFVTLSGVTLLGIGSAFWGIVAGGAMLGLRQWRSAP